MDFSPCRAGTGAGVFPGNDDPLHTSIRILDFEILGFGILEFWDSGIPEFWNSMVREFLNFGILGFWNYGPLDRSRGGGGGGVCQKRTAPAHID